MLWFVKLCKSFVEKKQQKLSYISGKVYSEPWHNGSFLYFWKLNFLALYFSYFSGSNFPCSKNEKDPL